MSGLLPSGLRLVAGKLKDLASDIVTVRTGTVVSDYAPATQTLVTLDNDPEQASVQAIATNGSMPSGTRVWMIAYPPRGLAVVGAFSGLSVFELETQIAALQAASADTGWIAPTLTNTWANYASGFQSAAYRKIGNQVFIRGLVKDGVVGGATPIFTMPVGFRPTAGIVMYAGISAATRVTAGSTGGPSPNSTGAQIGAAPAHTHDLQGHGHTPGSLTSSNMGARIDVSTGGAVALNDTTHSNAYVGLWGSFFID